MFTSEPKELTDVTRVFLELANASHRQYEALRAFFVAGVPGVEVARRFGYTPGSFRVLVRTY
jgi:hypothetical protein